MCGVALDFSSPGTIQIGTYIIPKNFPESQKEESSKSRLPSPTVPKWNEVGGPLQREPPNNTTKANIATIMEWGNNMHDGQACHTNSMTTIVLECIRKAVIISSADYENFNHNYQTLGKY